MNTVRRRDRIRWRFIFSRWARRLAKVGSRTFRLFCHYSKPKREPANEERYNCELARTVIKEYFYSETLSPERACEDHFYWTHCSLSLSRLCGGSRAAVCRRARWGWEFTNMACVCSQHTHTRCVHTHTPTRPHFRPNTPTHAHTHAAHTLYTPTLARLKNTSANMCVRSADPTELGAPWLAEARGEGQVHAPPC